MKDKSKRQGGKGRRCGQGRVGGCATTQHRYEITPDWQTAKAQTVNSGWENPPCLRPPVFACNQSTVCRWCNKFTCTEILLAITMPQKCATNTSFLNPQLWWPSGEVSTSRARDPGIDSHFTQGQVIPVTCRVSAGTGWPTVSILWLGEIASLIWNFYLSVAARTTVQAEPTLRHHFVCCWEVKQPWNIITKKQTTPQTLPRLVITQDATSLTERNTRKKTQQQTVRTCCWHRIQAGLYVWVHRTVLLQPFQPVRIICQWKQLK